MRGDDGTLRGQRGADRDGVERSFVVKVSGDRQRTVDEQRFASDGGLHSVPSRRTDLDYLSYLSLAVFVECRQMPDCVACLLLGKPQFIELSQS
jgi:hypothetical protein